MLNDASDPALSSLLRRFDAAGGVLDYVFLDGQNVAAPHPRHRAAAIAGMVEVDRRLERWALQKASAEFPVEKFFRVRSDATKLMGKQVSFATFWGTDNVDPKPLGANALSIPNVDGYKTAFFHPPYGLHAPAGEQAALFAGINRYVLGPEPERAEIFSWSTDWSNYFDAGHEWWGAFYWTIQPADSQRMVVVGASSTD